MAPINKRHWLVQNLLAQPDIAYVSPSIIVRPVRHFVRSIIAHDIPHQGDIGRMAGTWQMTSLWTRTNHVLLDGFIDSTISVAQRGEITILHIPDPKEDDDFQDQLNTVTLPFLRSVESLDHFYGCVMGDPENTIFEEPDVRLRLELAMGNFDASRRLVEQNSKQWFGKPVNDWEEESVERTRHLCGLLGKEDYAGIAALFHGWEALAAERQKIGHLWEPSPFPFEEGYDAWKRQSGLADR